MRSIVKSRKWQVLAVLMVVAFGAWAVPAARDKYEVAKMTETMKTVCVGRFLIDLPEKAEHSMRGAWIDGFDVWAFDESDAEFETRVKAREAKIRATPDYLGRDKNMEQVKEIRTANGLVGKVFVFGRHITDGDAGYGEDREHYHYENVAVAGYVHLNGFSVNLTAKLYDPDHVMGNLTRLIEQLVPNPDNHIPAEPGFCMDRVFFRDPLTADQGERVTMFAGLPEHPDFAVVFDTTAGAKPDEYGLVARSQRSRDRRSLDERVRIRDLFSGKRDINGIPGEQVLTRFVELNFTWAYYFTWELHGTKDDVFRPLLTLEMETGITPRAGGPAVQSSLSESALLDLWDKISSSIRIRPTQAAKAATTAPPAPPLGTSASAGDICPQSGWWQCGDGGNGVKVYGGQRQYLRQGERMPQALLLPPQTLWEKVKGLQSSFEATTATPWKLVDRRSRRRTVSDVPLAQATAGFPKAASCRRRPSQFRTGCSACYRTSLR
jgi:hypothetical protein